MAMCSSEANISSVESERDVPEWDVPEWDVPESSPPTVKTTVPRSAHAPPDADVIM